MLAHNNGRFLLPAVRSILGQTYKDFELVIIDNASTDGSVEDVMRLNDPRIRLMRESVNHRIAGGMNLAFAQAKGAYIVIADADDLWMPRRLERQISQLKLRPESMALACGTETIDAADVTIGKEFVLQRPRDFRIYTAYSTGGVTPCMAFRRECFESLMWRPEFEYAPDFDFVSRVAERGDICGVSEVLFRYRRQPSQVTQRFRAKIVATEGAVRLVVARRRSGKAEDVERLMASVMQGVEDATPLPFLYERLAGLSEQEGFPLLVALNARRWVIESRRLSILWKAGLRALRASVRADKERKMVWRMFLLGPVRAHRLEPMQ